MSKLLVLCVESNKQKQTDALYIDKTLKTFYKINNDIIISYVYMGSKTNYDKPKVTNQIKDNFKKSVADEKYVVYFIDTDDYNSNIEDKNLNEKIEKYCISNNYYLVWFCKDVEEVYWHKQIDDGEKVKYAKKFNIGKSLLNATIQNLSAKKYSKKKSNLILIMDNLLDRQ